jgi:hypothetical protein
MSLPELEAIGLHVAVSMLTWLFRVGYAYVDDTKPTIPFGRALAGALTTGIAAVLITITIDPPRQFLVVFVAVGFSAGKPLEILADYGGLLLDRLTTDVKRNDDRD